jgi:hypothetical protein
MTAIGRIVVGGIADLIELLHREDQWAARNPIPADVTAHGPRPAEARAAREPDGAFASSKQAQVPIRAPLHDMKCCDAASWPARGVQTLKYHQLNQLHR